MKEGSFTSSDFNYDAFQLDVRLNGDINYNSMMLFITILGLSLTCTMTPVVGLSKTKMHTMSNRSGWHIYLQIDR